MFLSKIHLDIHNIQIRKCIHDCQNMHRSIQRLFHGSRQDRSVLYRINPEKLDVYIWSANKPDINDMPTGMILRGMKDFSIIEKQLVVGQCFGFNIIAAPSKKVMVDGEKNSKRRFLRNPQERIDWFERQGKKYGFELLKVQENQTFSVTGQHREENGGKIHCQVIEFQGILRIRKCEDFQIGWKYGIGPGKAYGQGLLMLCNHNVSSRHIIYKIL